MRTPGASLQSIIHLATHHTAVQCQHHGCTIAEVDWIVVTQPVCFSFTQLSKLSDAVQCFKLQDLLPAEKNNEEDALS